MPRSVADATRFTPTAPHAHSKSPVSSSSTATSPRNTPQETPQQKVARLRAAALKAKAGRISTFDRIVVTGRAWADRAHRFVTLSLVGLTGISAIYATVAISDMLVYTRRKKREYLAQQSHLLEISIADAAAAEALGTATDEQLALLKREREHAAYEAELAAKKKLGVVERAKGWLFSGLSRDDVEGEGGREAEGVLAQVQALHAERETQDGRAPERPEEFPTSSSPPPSSSSPSSSRSWSS